RLFYHTSSTQTYTHTAVQAHSPRSSHITLYHAHTHSLQGDTTYTHSTSRNTLDHTHTNTHSAYISLNPPLLVNTLTHTHTQPHTFHKSLRNPPRKYPELSATPSHLIPLDFLWLSVFFSAYFSLQ